LIAPTYLSNNISMSKIEILEELPKLTKVERREIRLKLAELDGDDWIDDDDPLTADEKALLDARLPPTRGILMQAVPGKKLKPESARPSYKRTELKSGA
jgi:hypothetical protein